MPLSLQRFSRFSLCALLLWLGLGLTGCEGGDGIGPGRQTEVTVITRNPYLGGNIFRLAEAQSPQQLPPWWASSSATWSRPIFRPVPACSPRRS